MVIHLVSSQCKLHYAMMLYQDGVVFINSTYSIRSGVFFNCQSQTLHCITRDYVNSTPIVKDDIQLITTMLHTGMKNVGAPSIRITLDLFLSVKTRWITQLGRSVASRCSTSSPSLSSYSSSQTTAKCSNLLHL